MKRPEPQQTLGLRLVEKKWLDAYEYVFTSKGLNIRNDVAHAFYIPQDYGIIQATLVFLCILRLTIFKKMKIVMEIKRVMKKTEYLRSCNDLLSRRFICFTEITEMNTV